MTIVYVTTGAWGAGTGTPNSAAQVDRNFYDLDQRVLDVVADVAEGKRIDHVTSTTNSMTFYYTDGTTQVIPLPVATITYVGEWLNGTSYFRGSMVSVRGLGMYQILQDHVTPPAPAPFDPNAVDGSGNPLYQLMMPLRDVNYDAAIFMPGTMQRNPGELIFVGIANRTMQLKSGSTNCYAYLDVGNEGTGATDIVLAITRNRVQIGTVTFAANGATDTAGGQVGSFNIPALTSFAAGDTYGIRVTHSDNAFPSGLSITLPFLRTDI